jgi:hypothetical protein
MHMDLLFERHKMLTTSVRRIEILYSKFITNIRKGDKLHYRKADQQSGYHKNNSSQKHNTLLLKLALRFAVGLTKTDYTL